MDPDLIERSRLLGHYQVNKESDLCKRLIPYHRIDKAKFESQIQELQLPDVNLNNIEESLRTLTDTLYSVSEDCKKREECFYSTNDKQRLRWKRMIEMKDSKALWRGINWKGEFQETASKEQPPESAFQDHMQGFPQ